MIVSLFFLMSCTNNFESNEIQKTMTVNEAIASKYMCKLTADIIEEKNKRLEISIQGAKASDDLLIGKIFIDYYQSLKENDLKFDRYVLKENGNAVYTISNEQVASLLSKVDFYQDIVDQLKTSRKNLYELLDQNLKNKMNFDMFDTEFSKLSLKNLVFSGFVYNDSLMSFGYENDQNRLLIVIDPLANTNEVLGIEVR